MVKIEAIQSKEKRICSYSRVSTKDEEQDSSYLMQKEYWENKLSNMPNTKYIGTFADKGSGRKIIQRKEFCRMIDLAKAGFIDEIYTKSIYRFARNGAEALRILQELKSLGVAVIFEEEEINSLTLNNTVIMHLKSLFAEEEINQMSKNVTFSVRQRFSQGIPDHKPIYGYTIVDKQYVIIEEEAKVIRLIFTLALKGYGEIGITKQLTQLKIKSPQGFDEWSRSTVHDIMRNEKYKGDLLLQKTFSKNGKRCINKGELPKYYVSNNHEPIIDAEVFDEVQEMLQKRSISMKNLPRNTYDFTGKIQCICGCNYRHKINSKIINFEKGQWLCAKRNLYGIEMTQCNSMPIPDKLLEKITLDAYNEYIDIPYEIKMPSELKKEINDIEKLRFSLNKLYIDNLITLEQFNDEKEQIRARKQELDQKLQDYDILSLYKKPAMKLKEYTSDIVTKHLDKIIADGGKLTFIFKNQQSVTKEYKNEHRKYIKAY